MLIFTLPSRLHPSWPLCLSSSLLVLHDEHYFALWVTEAHVRVAQFAETVDAVPIDPSLHYLKEIFY